VFFTNRCYCENHKRKSYVRVRDLERLLTAHGVGSAKVDATTRKLRQSGRLPKGGRGLNAPAMSAKDAALILLAVAGSSKAIEADARVRKLEALRGSVSKSRLIDALTTMLLDPSELAAVLEVRISRTRRMAKVVFRDGRIEGFGAAAADQADKFYVEGVLLRKMLERVANAILTDADHGG
jgi:hypothetical protein